MFTLTLDEIRNKMVFYFNIFNGVINPTSKINAIIEVSDLNEGALSLLYNDGSREVQFNPKVIQNCICNPYSGVYAQNELIHLVLHELIHSTQRVNQIAYENNITYRDYIECIANTEASRFIINYKGWIEARTGVKILDEYLNTLDMSLIQSAKMMETISFADAEIQW